MSPGADSSPEARARYTIDSQLEAAGWAVQDRDEMNVWAGSSSHGVAVREFAMREGHGFADYLLFVNGKAVGAVEAKKVGHTLDGVFSQLEKYATGLPEQLEPALYPLPFIYASTGTETKFHNQLDPNPRPRLVFSFHRPSTIAEWLTADPLPQDTTASTPRPANALTTEDSSIAPQSSSDSTYAEQDAGTSHAAERMELWDMGDLNRAVTPRPSTLRGRLRRMPAPVFGDMWPNQIKALENLEKSLAQDRPRSLIQMATGSGKTRTAINIIYRLIRHGGARRVLFLVDRSNLGKQAEDAFCSFRTPDTGRKFN